MASVRKSQPAAQKIDTRPTSAAKPSGVSALPAERVAARAYEIWQANGRPHGRDQEHWFQAERELRGTQSSR